MALYTCSTADVHGMALYTYYTADVHGMALYTYSIADVHGIALYTFKARFRAFRQSKFECAGHESCSVRIAVGKPFLRLRILSWS